MRLGGDAVISKLYIVLCAEGAHALASAYQKLFRRHTHLE